MPVGAIIGAGAVGAVGSVVAGNQAAGATQEAANASNAAQLQMFNTSFNAQAPWRTVGGQALNSVAALYGLPGYTAPTSGRGGQSGGLAAAPPGSVSGAFGRFPGLSPELRDRIPPREVMGGGTPPAMSQGDAFDAFRNSTGYQFRFDEGQNALERLLARSGQFFSGQALEDAQRYGQNFASNEFGNYVNQLNNLAGLGQTSAAQSGNAAIQTGQGMAANTMAAGNARAGAYTNAGNQLGNLLSQGAALYGYSQQPPPSVYGSPGTVQNYGAFDSYGNAYGAFTSDRRLKRDIRQIGFYGALPVYEYHYLDDDVLQHGFMADEVEQLAPHAVSIDDDGFKRVNYRAAMHAAMQVGHA